MFVSNDMKHMDKVFGDVMKPQAHGHVFRSALQFPIWYKALAWKQEEGHDHIRKDPSDGGPVINETESVQLRPSFNTENSVLNYISAVENYLKPTATKRAAHKPVVEMVIYFL